MRRSELCALDWRDLDLDGRKPPLLVGSGKGGKSRRQPVPASLARQLQRLANAHNPEPTNPVFCGLQGGRLQETILADIIARAAKRAGIEKHVTAHTLRHTAATWHLSAAVVLAWLETAGRRFCSSARKARRCVSLTSAMSRMP